MNPKETFELDTRHWRLEDFSERVTRKQWQSVLLNYKDKIVYKGTPGIQIIAKHIGAGIYEIRKDLTVKK